MPNTMTYEEWMQRTRLGITSVRPSKMKEVDAALNQYNRSPTDENLSVLRNALMALYGEKGSLVLQKDPRNGNDAIEELLGQVLLGRRAMPFNFRQELAKVAQARVQGQIFGGEIQKTVFADGKNTRIKVKQVGHLADSNGMLRIVADKIQQDLDCRISYGPIKTLESASRKVKDDYNGDWYQLKDAVRLTVIATNGGKLTGVSPERLTAIEKKIKKVAVPSSGLTILKQEEAVGGSPGNRPKDNPCGYSGWNFVIRLTIGGDSRYTGAGFGQMTPGWPGEIQANIPSMMYGKMSEEDLCKIFDKEGYESLKSEFDVEGGLGHIFYEIWRVDRTGAKGIAAAELAGRYHDYLRNPQARDKAALKTDIAAFKAANAARFKKKH